MESGPLSEASFKAFGEEVVLFCHITSRVKDDSDQTLLKEKGGSGFPYLVFLDGEGEVVAKQNDRSVEAFGKTNSALTSLAKLKKGKRGKKAARGIFIAKLDLGRFEYEEAKTEYAALKGFSKPQQAAISSGIASLEVDLIRKETGRDRKAATVRLFEMYEGGRIPSGGAARMFWSAVQASAVDKQDAKLYEEAITKYKAILNNDKRYADTFKYWDEVLVALQKDEAIPKYKRGRR